MSPNAIILCAGQGKRLQNLFPNTPKVLIPFFHKTLLDRHLQNLVSSKIYHVWLVLGYQKLKIIHHIQNHIQAQYPSLHVHYIHNPLFQQGSIYSLYLARHQLTPPFTLVMDADVLYHPDILSKLIYSQSLNALLIDPSQKLNDQSNQQNNEEMIVSIQNNQAVSISRASSNNNNNNTSLIAESVGFFKFHPDAANLLKQILEHLIQQGYSNLDYEYAINQVFKKIHFGFESVQKLPWTEIDFKSDIDKALSLLPRIDSNPI